MRRKLRQIMAIIAAFCIAFTGMPLMAGSLDAHAASKFTIKSAKAVSSSAVKLTWKKYKKSNTYEVYRDGKLIKRLTKTSYTDEGLDASTPYKYKVKALQKYTKKQKQWFNKKTKKWQTKKPAKKYRGKSKTVKKIKYKTLGTSKTKTVTTKAPDRVIFDDTDLDQNVSGSAVKAYALSSITVKVDYSDTENLKDKEGPGYTQQFMYNTNGLLKKSISTADPNKWGSQICGTESFSYTGSKIREMMKDTGESLPERTVYSYEGGKLKSSTQSYPTSDDDEPFTKYHKVNSMGRVDSTYYSVTLLGEREDSETNYQYTDEGYLCRMSYSVRRNQYEAFEYDGHGNAVQMIHYGITSPVSSAVQTHKNTAANKYTDGRLSGTLISNYNGIKTEISLSYKEVSVPEEYQKAFSAQQHDIIFRYVYTHMYLDTSILDLPLGLVG